MKELKVCQEFVWGYILLYTHVRSRTLLYLSSLKSLIYLQGKVSYILRKVRENLSGSHVPVTELKQMATFGRIPFGSLSVKILNINRRTKAISWSSPLLFRGDHDLGTACLLLITMLQMTLCSAVTVALHVQNVTGEHAAGWVTHLSGENAWSACGSFHPQYCRI